MKGLKDIYIPVLSFVGIILFFVALANLSYGDIETRHGLGYVNHVASNGSVTLNSTTFTKVMDVNIDRSHVTFCSQSKRSENKVVFINYATVAESVDNTGIILFGEDCFTMPSDSIYTGEISAIAVTGNPLLGYIEY